MPVKFDRQGHSYNFYAGFGPEQDSMVQDGPAQDSLDHKMFEDAFRNAPTECLLGGWDAWRLKRIGW